MLLKLMKIKSKVNMETARRISTIIHRHSALPSMDNETAATDFLIFSAAREH